MKLLAMLFMLFAICAAKLPKLGKCSVKGHSFQTNETYSPKEECVMYTCLGHSGYTYITHYCETPSAKPLCKITSGQLSKSYPKCCPMLLCLG